MLCIYIHIYTYACVHAQLLSRGLFFVTPWTLALQASLSMEIPGKNIGVGCYFLLQGIFPGQGSNRYFLCLLHCRQILSTTTLVKPRRDVNHPPLTVYHLLQQYSPQKGRGQLAKSEQSRQLQCLQKIQFYLLLSQKSLSIYYILYWDRFLKEKTLYQSMFIILWLILFII